MTKDMKNDNATKQAPVVQMSYETTTPQWVEPGGKPSKKPEYTGATKSAPDAPLQQPENHQDHQHENSHSDCYHRAFHAQEQPAKWVSTYDNTASFRSSCTDHQSCKRRHKIGAVAKGDAFAARTRTEASQQLNCTTCSTSVQRARWWRTPVQGVRGGDLLGIFGAPPSLSRSCLRQHDQAQLQDHRTRTSAMIR